MSVEDQGPMGHALLEAKDLSIAFGGLEAIHGLSLSVPPRRIVALIGPNGAGKTTAINAFTGMYPVQRGDVRFKGSSILGLKPYQIAALGIARTFQQVQLFLNMTVLDNVMTGRHCRMKSGFFGGFLHHGRERQEEREALSRAKEILEFFGLSGRLDERVTQIPIRDQKRLEMARALASEPSLVLLDEPAAGLNIQETEEVAELILRLRERGLTILLVEHNMPLVMGISDWVVVLHYGRKIGEGPPDRIQKEKAVIQAYLGG